MHSQIDSENNLTATTNLNRHIDRTHSVPVCQMSIPYYTSTHSMAVPCYADDLYMNSILFGQATTNELHDYEQRECVKCGTIISAQYIHWSQDESGFNLCDQCQMSSIAQREQITFANQCANCCTRKTTLWRRNSSGDSVCNACGLYYKLHGVNRPWSLKKDGIQTRKRKSKKDQSPTQNEITFSDKNSKQSSSTIADTSSYTFEYHEHCNRASPQLNYSPIRTSDSLHPHCLSSSFKQHPFQWNHQGPSSPFYQDHSVVCHQVKDEIPHSWNRYMNYGV